MQVRNATTAAASTDVPARSNLSYFLFAIACQISFVVLLNLHNQSFVVEIGSELVVLSQ
jgi:ABC-type sulfate/molybdate transport systems ATPase subunit